MYEIDQTYLAYELAYRTERLSGRRGGTRAQHAATRRPGDVRRWRGAGRPAGR